MLKKRDARIKAIYIFLLSIILVVVSLISKAKGNNAIFV